MGQGVAGWVGVIHAIGMGRGELCVTDGAGCVLSFSRSRADPAITSLRHALMRISELESAAANFRRERQAYNRMERDLRRERDAARELLTETVRSIVLAQCLPNDLPYFAFYFNRHLPRLTQQEQAIITRFASPGLLRMRETMRALQEGNADLRPHQPGLEAGQ